MGGIIGKQDRTKRFHTRKQVGGVKIGYNVPKGWENRGFCAADFRCFLNCKAIVMSCARSIFAPRTIVHLESREDPGDEVAHALS